MVEGLLVRPGARACIVARFMPAGVTLPRPLNGAA
jgi:hypothetical protein